MKDYRQYSKPYAPNKWENDKDWLARRLEFLWTLSDYYPDRYRELHFGNEKNELYEYYGTDDEIMRIASKLHSGQYSNKPNLKSKTYKEIFEEYDNVKNIKNSDIDTFLRKRIYIKYYFLMEYIKDCLGQEYHEYSMYK